MLYKHVEDKPVTAFLQLPVNVNIRASLSENIRASIGSDEHKEEVQQHCSVVDEQQAIDAKAKVATLLEQDPDDGFQQWAQWYETAVDLTRPHLC